MMTYKILDAESGKVVAWCASALLAQSLVADYNQKRGRVVLTLEGGRELWQ